MPPVRIPSYTFIEMLIVAVIVTLAGAVVVPRIVVSTRRMTVESALSALRTPFAETAQRARAGGQTMTLTLNVEDGKFLVGKGVTGLDHDWRPAPLPMARVDANGEEQKAAAILGAAAEYAVPETLEWTDLPDRADGESVVFTFFPDGEAAGPQLGFAIRNERYRLIVDSVLGRGTIVFDE